VTDIVTPYFVAVMEELGRRLPLTVIFCARTGSRASGWEVALPGTFRSTVLDGLMVARRSPDGTDYHVDPRIFAAVARSRPDVVVSAGFSVPSAYAAAYCRVTGAPFLVYSDGTSVSEAGFGRGRLTARRVLLSLAAGAVALSPPAQGPVRGARRPRRPRLPRAPQHGHHRLPGRSGPPASCARAVPCGSSASGG
jgi:hypothetical protein